MKNTILVFVLSLFFALSASSQQSNVGGGLEFNYLIGHLNAYVRGEIPMTKKDYIVMKASTNLVTTAYSMSVGYQRMIYLHEKLPMWVGMNITRDISLTDVFGSRDLHVGGIEIPVGIQYNFSSGIAPYVEVGYGTLFREVTQVGRETRGYHFRMKVGAKYTFGKD